VAQRPSLALPVALSTGVLPITGAGLCKLNRILLLYFCDAQSRLRNFRPSTVTQGLTPRVPESRVHGIPSYSSTGSFGCKSPLDEPATRRSKEARNLRARQWKLRHFIVALAGNITGVESFSAHCDVYQLSLVARRFKNEASPVGNGRNQAAFQLPRFSWLGLSLNFQ